MEKYISVNAVVLKCSDFSESSRMLTMYSDSLGLIRVSAKAVRRKDSMNLSSAQPFAFSRFELCRGKNNIYTLVSADLIENFYGLSHDLGRFTVAAELTGLLMKIAAEEQPDQSVLRLYLNMLFALCYTGGPGGLIRSAFVIRLFGISGFLPGAAETARKYCPGAGETLVTALEHVLGCDLKQLFGFDASEDIACGLDAIARKIEAEEF